MSRRLAAYVLDLITIYLILFFAATVSEFFGRSLPLGALDSRLGGFALLIAYMTLLQSVTHNTIGKYICGIQVLSSQPPSKHPSVGQIVLRETLGRGVSLFFGIGYWNASKQARKQAWSDQMANTIVVARTTNRWIRRALIATLSIGAVVYGGAILYGERAEERQKRYTEISEQLSALGAELKNLRANIEQVRSSDAIDWTRIQENNRKLLSLLDQYEPGLQRMKSLIGTLLQERLASPTETAALKSFLLVYDIRLREASILRREANIILAFRRGVDSLETLQSQVDSLDSEWQGLQKQVPDH
jgi:uncharacterized RDD family membrane protein YckC